MEEKGYPKFQWSVFVKNGKDTQYVVRSDSFEEFVAMKTQVLAEVARDLIASGANVAHSVQTQPVAQPSEPVNMSAPRCAMHGTPMKERQAKNGGIFWDHREKDEAGEWRQCNGTGWKY